MSGKCAAINPSAGSAEAMLQAVDCYIETKVQTGFASLLGPDSVFNIALTAALTIYVAIIGYRMIFGRSQLSLGEMAPRLLLIGALLALTSNWATYQTLVYNVLTDGPQEVVAAVSPASGPDRNVIARVDMLSGRMVDLADAWTEFDARPDAAMGAPDGVDEALPPLPATGLTAMAMPKESLGPNLLLVSALILILASAGVLVVAKVILGLLLLLGPLFALFALFGSTRGLALGWARAAVTMALVPVLTTLTAAGATAALEPLLVQMYRAAGEGVFSLRAAITILVIVLIMAAVAVQLFRIGRTIVSGWTLLSAASPRGSDHALLAHPTPASDAAPSVVHNERLQGMIGSIERGVAQSALVQTPSASRTAFLVPSAANEGAGPLSMAAGPNRRLAAGRAPAMRSPVKAFRKAS